MATARPVLTLYLRHYCHLCTDMLQALRGLQSELGFELVLADIDEDADLTARYQTLVPVLSHDGREICRYFLDENAVRTCLTGS